MKQNMEKAESEYSSNLFINKNIIINTIIITTITNTYIYEFRLKVNWYKTKHAKIATECIELIFCIHQTTYIFID